MNTPVNKTELELNEGLFVIETEDRLETVQAINEEVAGISCCGDSGSAAN